MIRFPPVRECVPKKDSRSQSFLYLYHEALRGREFDQRFGLVVEELGKRLSHAGQDGVVVRQNDPARDHFGIEILQASKCALVQVDVEMREGKLLVLRYL